MDDRFLEVIAPGLQTTVQDLGRSGFQALGVPPSGALDATALRLANRLVGNPEDAAGLELRLAGPSLRVAATSIRVALAGTSAPLILEGDGARREIPAWQAVDCRAGEIVRVAPLRDTATACLAISGGIDVRPVLGSRSTYLAGGFGGFCGRALKIGDRLPLGAAPDGPPLALPRPPANQESPVLRVVLGPQADWFSDEGLAAFLRGPYRVTGEADRMGLRLAGPQIAHRAGFDIVSDANVRGSIQVPGSHQPILLLAEHGTAGGYPKIATLISADLGLAGRLPPGAEIRFAAVGVEEAEREARAAEAAFQRLVATIAPADAAAAPDPAVLLSENLISGVIADDA